MEDSSKRHTVPLLYEGDRFIYQDQYTGTITKVMIEDSTRFPGKHVLVYHGLMDTPIKDIKGELTCGPFSLSPTDIKYLTYQKGYVQKMNELKNE